MDILKNQWYFSIGDIQKNHFKLVLLTKVGQHILSVNLICQT